MARSPLPKRAFSSAARPARRQRGIGTWRNRGAFRCSARTRRHHFETESGTIQRSDFLTRRHPAPTPRPNVAHRTQPAQHSIISTVRCAFSSGPLSAKCGFAGRRFDEMAVTCHAYPHINRRRSSLLCPFRASLPRPACVRRDVASGKYRHILTAGDREPQLRNAALGAALLLSLSACGGGTSSSTTGAVYMGPLRNASVSVYAVAADGSASDQPIAHTVTRDDGTFVPAAPCTIRCSCAPRAACMTRKRLVRARRCKATSKPSSRLRRRA
jgi:hypothetical protein